MIEKTIAVAAGFAIGGFAGFILVMLTVVIVSR